MTRTRAYYNENDPDAAAALRQLIADDVIASGDVDDRSIKDVRADDIKGYRQHHFFAGGGLWSVALRLAGWPDERAIWTASCPCQPISTAGRRRGARDPRHLWPDLLRILRAARSGGHGPAVLMGEQVSGALGYGWFDRVRADLAKEDYASRVRDIPACAVDAPIERNRLFWIALARAQGKLQRRRLGQGEAQQQRALAANGDVGSGDVASTKAFGSSSRPHQSSRSSASVEPQRQNDRGDSRAVGGAASARRQGLAISERREGTASGRSDAQRADGGDRGRGALVGAERGQLSWQRLAELARQGAADADRADGPIEIAAIGRNGSWWADAEWIICHDGKARRTKPGIPMLVDGLPGRVAAWRLIGNAISPILTAEVIGAFLDAERAA